MRFESIPISGSASSLRLRGRRLPGAAILCGLAAIGGFPAQTLGADETPSFPSRVILGLRSTCMSTCQEKEDAAPCTRYCDCHLFELRRDLSDSQVERLLLTAERGGTGAESIRKWLHASAKLCEKRVFGEEIGDDSGEKKSPK